MATYSMGGELELKTCGKCNLEFSVKKCPYCRKESDAAYRAANAESRQAYNKAWRDANPDKCEAHAKAYRDANRDKLRERSSEWMKANPEKAAESSRAWRRANMKMFCIYGHNRRAKERQNGGSLSKGLAEKLYKIQKGLCACCKEPLGDDYHLDHIMPVSLGGANEDWNIQLLRSKCNMSKKDKHPIDFMQKRGFLL